MSREGRSSFWCDAAMLDLLLRQRLDKGEQKAKAPWVGTLFSREVRDHVDPRDIGPATIAAQLLGHVRLSVVLSTADDIKNAELAVNSLNIWLGAMPPGRGGEVLSATWVKKPTDESTGGLTCATKGLIMFVDIRCQVPSREEDAAGS